MNENRPSERGAVAVFVALLIMPMMLLLAFVVDTGNWWTHKRHLHTQADAAAFAGGDQFFQCFRQNADPGAVYTDMTTKADEYVGLDTSTFNNQLGGWTKGTIDRLYNSKTFPGQASTNPPDQTPDDTIPVSQQNVCQSQMFDVKVTEQNAKSLFGSISIPGVGQVPHINAHARVQLYQIASGRPSLPLAVPDITPKDVAVTFIDEANPGTALAGPIHLTKSVTSGGITYWTGPATITVPDGYTNIGMRVGLGHAVGNCAGTSGVSGQYICYDNASTDTSLVVVRGYKAPSGGSANNPELSQVWETTTGCGVNSGSPFFSDIGTQTTCTEWVQAKVDFGSATPGCPAVCVFANGQQMTYDSGTRTWSKNFSADLASGAVPVTLTWTNTGATCGKKPCRGQQFSEPTPHQQGYGADADYGATGPVKVVNLAENSSAVGSPYALQSGSHTLTVTVGVQGDLEAMPVPSPTTLLRFQVNTSNSITTAVQCDPGGNNEFLNAIRYGCQTPYAINPYDSCEPDPTPPGSAEMCIPTRNGNLGTTVNKAMDDRFGCPANNWPNYNQGDPRLVQLITTNFSNLLGSGKTLVPVDNFATFYVTGWTGNKPCGNNEAFPGKPPKNPNGYIWGHFIKYTNGGDKPGTNLCTTPGNNIIPCVPVLVR